MKKQSFEFIDSGWDKVIAAAVATNCKRLHIICPFIKLNAAKRLLTAKCPDLIQVVTRFHLGEMCDGVNDTDALRLLLENGARIRGVKGLHAKLYLFENRQAIVTSANLTEAALLRNHEFGFVSTRDDIIARCQEYFDTLWKKAGPDLDVARLEIWEERIAEVRLAGSRPSLGAGLSDEGAKAGLTPVEPTIHPLMTEAPQSFVKFFGEGNYRSTRDLPTLAEVKRTGCHWACGYPKNKRPRRVQDGAVMFMGRLVEDPNDTMIYGRAVAFRHLEGRDEATPDEIELRDWKKDWPIYVRVHHAEFVAGTLGNGISLASLMDVLKADSFMSTQRNAREGGGNTDPRSAYRQQAAVQLTEEAFVWLNQRIEQAFLKHGKLTPAELETLDWPSNRFQSAPVPAHLPEYEEWLVKAENKAGGTGKSYSSFLIRCAEHYGEVIDDKTVKTDADANGMIERIKSRAKESTGIYDGRFTSTNIKDGFIPALHAYLRFIQATFPVKLSKR